MTNTPYNGSAVLIDKIEGLLTEKKLSTPAAMRLMLELELNNIKRNHERDMEIEKLKQEMQYSWGLWAAKHPKTATALFLLIYSFALSDIRKPFLDWLVANIKTVFSLL